MRIRFEFSKDNEAKYISHLDLLRVFERTARRAGLPLAHSQGFNPHPKIAFGPALALGTASDKEYVDISFDADLDPAGTVQVLNEKFPPGIRVIRAQEVVEGAAALNAFVNRARYSVECSLIRDVSQQELEQYCQELLKKDRINVTKSTKKGLREKDIRPGIFSLECCLSRGVQGQDTEVLAAFSTPQEYPCAVAEELAVFSELKESSGKAVINCELQLSPEGSVRPEDVLEVLIAQGMPVEQASMRIRRKGLFYCSGDSCINPIQVLL